MIPAGKFATLLERVFFKALEAKTGWGKEELKLLHRRCEGEVLRALIDGDEPNAQD